MIGLARDVNNHEEDYQRGKYLTFQLSNESYGVEIKYVTEIIGMQNITRIPELPDYIKGVINLRGKIIPVMDVRLRFTKEYKDYDDRTCIIVADVNEVSIGLVVDRVSEVIDIADENLSSPPKINKDYNSRYVKAIGRIDNDVKILLDVERLIDYDFKKAADVI